MNLPRTPDGLSGALTKSFGWVAAFLVGALLSMLLESKATEARLERAERDIVTNGAKISQIEQSLQNGGPPALARRVDDLQGQVNTQYGLVNKKLDDVMSILISMSRR